MNKATAGRALRILGLCGALFVVQTSVEASTQDAKRPNILLVIADDWSFGHAGAYGCKWINTPAFDRVAREGVLFSNAFTNNPKCSPCRASLLTGRNTWQLEEAMCHYGVFPAKWPVYPDLLEQAGYKVGHTGKGWGPGDFKAGGFRAIPPGRLTRSYKLKPPLQGIGTTDFARNFAAFLEERKPGQPFCFWVGGHEPHRPYEDGAGRRAGRDPARVTLPAYYPDSNVIRSDMLDYALEVEWFDANLGKVLDQLEKIGELDDTLILVTSDHGMPFPRVKGQIYEAGFHLPMAVRWGRRVKPGRVVDDFINVRDLAPTFLEAAGLNVPASMSGRSFLGALAEREIGPDRSHPQPDGDRQRAARRRPAQRSGLPGSRHPYSGIPLRPQLRARPLAGRKPRDELPELRQRPDQDADHVALRRVLPPLLRQTTRRRALQGRRRPRLHEKPGGRAVATGPEATAQDRDGSSLAQDEDPRMFGRAQSSRRTSTSVIEGIRTTPG